MNNKVKIVFSVLSVLLIVGILGGMIGTTVVLSKKSEKEWEYKQYDQELEYFSADYANVDFGYITNFKKQISVYLGGLLNAEFAGFLNIEKVLEVRLSSFADKVVNAMAMARISAEKLNAISRMLQENPISGIYTRFSDFFDRLAETENVESEIINFISNASIFSVLGDLLHDFMEKTTLTENEIANFIYYYILQNESEEYLEYFHKMGKEYFIKIVSETVYALSSMQSESLDHYNQESLFYIIQTILYELGDLYLDISDLTGGVDTFEHVFRFTWNYNTQYESYEELNALTAEVKGDIGTLCIVMGLFLKEISVDDISVFYTFRNAEWNEREQKMIVASIALSQTVQRTYEKAKLEFDLSYENAPDFFLHYADMDATLDEIIATLRGGDDEEGNWDIFDESELDIFDEGWEEDLEDIEAEEVPDSFLIFSEALRFFNEGNFTMESFVAMDPESEEYKSIVENAQKIYAIEGGFSTLFGRLIDIWMLNKIEKITVEEE